MLEAGDVLRFRSEGKSASDTVKALGDIAWRM